MTDCLFCKMASGEIRPEVVYETEEILAFRDINPQAPTHVLVIPKLHIATMNDIEDISIAGKLLAAAQKVAAMEELEKDGYRTVINCNTRGGQQVYHLHLHVLGGRQMTWPPG